MKKTTIRILFVLWVCLNFSCGLLAKEPNGKLYYIRCLKSNESLVGYDFETDKEITVNISSYLREYDVFQNKLVYFYNDNKSRDLFVRIFDFDNKNTTNVLKLDIGKQCNDPMWLDEKSFSISYRDQTSGFARHKISFDGKMNQVISTKYEEDSMVYRVFYKNQNIGIVKSDPFFDRGFFEVIKDGRKIYQSDEDCHLPDFKNDNEICFLKNGNLYIYNLKNKKCARYTDFSENKWNPEEKNGYNRYSWREDGTLAIEYTSEAGSYVGIKVYSPAGKIIKTIKSSLNPKWAGR